MDDSISRQEVIDVLNKHSVMFEFHLPHEFYEVKEEIRELPTTQPERKWFPCSNPPKHHRDVLVRGTELIGNVTVHKVMQWDVDTWRPTNYASSIRWEEWSEI